MRALWVWVAKCWTKMFDLENHFNVKLREVDKRSNMYIYQEVNEYHKGT